MTDNQINSKSIIAAEIKRAMDSSRITETQIKELQAAIEKLLLKGNPQTDLQKVRNDFKDQHRTSRRNKEAQQGSHEKRKRDQSARRSRVSNRKEDNSSLLTQNKKIFEKTIELMPIEIESKPNNLAQSQVLPSIPEQEEKEKFGNTIFDIWKSRQSSIVKHEGISDTLKKTSTNFTKTQIQNNKEQTRDKHLTQQDLLPGKTQSKYPKLAQLQSPQQTSQHLGSPPTKKPLNRIPFRTQQDFLISKYNYDMHEASSQKKEQQLKNRYKLLDQKLEQLKQKSLRDHLNLNQMQRFLTIKSPKNKQMMDASTMIIASYNRLSPLKKLLKVNQINKIKFKGHQLSQYNTCKSKSKHKNRQEGFRG